MNAIVNILYREQLGSLYNEYYGVGCHLKDCLQVILTEWSASNEDCPHHFMLDATVRDKGKTVCSSRILLKVDYDYQAIREAIKTFDTFKAAHSVYGKEDQDE